MQSNGGRDQAPCRTPRYAGEVQLIRKRPEGLSNIAAGILSLLPRWPFEMCFVRNHLTMQVCGVDIERFVIWLDPNSLHEGNELTVAHSYAFSVRSPRPMCHILKGERPIPVSIVEWQTFVPREPG